MSSRAFGEPLEVLLNMMWRSSGKQASFRELLTYRKMILEMHRVLQIEVMLNLTQGNLAEGDGTGRVLPILVNGDDLVAPSGDASRFRLPSCGAPGCHKHPGIASGLAPQ